MKTNLRKLLSTLLAVAIVFGLFAAMPQTARAATGRIDIGGSIGLELSGNKGGTGWSWSAGNNVLNLDSAYTKQQIVINCAASDTISIVYSGNVTVFGIRCDGSMRIGRNTSDGKLTIDDIGGNTGIYAHGNVTISGIADIMINSVYSGIYAYGNVTISGGTVAINSSSGMGIRADENVTISGGTVAINSTSYGINAGENVTISGGTVAINSTGIGDGAHRQKY